MEKKVRGRIVALFTQPSFILTPSASGPPAVWVPSKFDIEELEAALWKYLERKSSMLRGISPDRYWRQYVGVTLPVGLLKRQQKFIYVNAFIGGKNPDDQLQQNLLQLQQHLLLVDDGGAAFWQVYYNVTNKTFKGFSVNGEA